MFAVLNSRFLHPIFGDPGSRSDRSSPASLAKPGTIHEGTTTNGRDGRVENDLSLHQLRLSLKMPKSRRRTRITTRRGDGVSSKRRFVTKDLKLAWWPGAPLTGVPKSA